MQTRQKISELLPDYFTALQLLPAVNMDLIIPDTLYKVVQLFIIGHVKKMQTLSIIRPHIWKWG